MIELPIKSVEAKSTNPRKLTIFSQAKVGKSSLLAQLKDNLIIDLEAGCHYYGGLFFDLKTYSKEQNITLMEAYRRLIQSLTEQKEKNDNKPIYKYLTIDTATVLQELAKEVAVNIYKTTPMGKNFNSNDILSLPSGGGYHYVRIAFDKLLEPLEQFYTDCLIISAHSKNSSISKNGQDLNALDINLAGALKLIVCSSSDAVGLLYRDKATNKNIITFKSVETNLATGARAHHLQGEEFVISEMIDKKLVTYWDKIFKP